MRLSRVDGRCRVKNRRFPNRGFPRINGRPATGSRSMPDGNGERDWEIVLDVFDAAQSRRGEPGHDDRKFLEAVHFFTVHNIAWRALPTSSVTGTASGSRSGGLPAPGCSRRSSSSSPRPARRRTWFRCSTARWCARMSPPPPQRGAAKSGARALTGRVLDQDPPQDAFRRPAHCLPSDRRRGQRLHPAPKTRSTSGRTSRPARR